MKVPGNGSNRLTENLLRRTRVKVVEHLEGKTLLLVPESSLRQDPPPAAPAFFNPAASLNRDVSVAIAMGAGTRTFCDSMAGVGARGLRLAKESEVEGVTLVDFNGRSLELARRSAALNGVQRKCESPQSGTSALLLSRHGRGARFVMVDVDPFGSPVGELLPALRAVADGGLLSVTATDTAVLCGVYPRVSERRYGSAPLNNSFHHETGVRILAGAAARLGAMVDLGAEPDAAHATRHYIRLYLRVRTGGARADRSLRSLGHLSWCPACGQVSLSDPRGRVCKCGKKARVAGPLWVGGLADGALLEASVRSATAEGLRRAAVALESLEGLDSFPPWSFSMDDACSSLGIASVPEGSLYRNLRRAGFRAMRTPFEKTGVKTDASYGEFLEAVRESSGTRGEGASAALARAPKSVRGDRQSFTPSQQ